MEVKTVKPKKEIFISHGKDQKSLYELKNMLLEFGLKPIVLSEQPSGGRTIVEKLEEYSNVGYFSCFLLLMILADSWKWEANGQDPSD
jgi:predicted nucleotide-binding protein